MVASKKICVDEAEKLLSLVDDEAEDVVSMPEETTRAAKANPKYLRVVVQPGDGKGSGDGAHYVNVRVPMSLIRAGIKLAALLPKNATDRINENLSEKGIDIDINHIKQEDVEELVRAMSELEVDVRDGKEKVRVYFE